VTFTLRSAARKDLEQIVAIYNSTIPSRQVTADTEPVSVESRVSWLEDHSPGLRPLWVVGGRSVERDLIIMGRRV
jgi:phosphinothricin acetyltransferase